MKRTIIRIVPHKASGAWRIVGGKWPAWKTKAAAVTFFAARLREAWQEHGQLGQLVVCRRDGSIAFERTYGRDPRRTPG
jgi:hypothetical protein